MEKYFIFFGALLVAVPLGTGAAAYSRRIREGVFGLLVFSTAFTDWYDINFIERWWYAGSTRGVEVSLVDLLMLIVFLSTLLTMRSERARLFWPASLGLMALYLAYAACSVLISDPKIFGVFELTKLVRGLFFFVTIAWCVRTRRDLSILLFALSAALIYNGVFSVVQRYFWHYYRVRGTFPHCNILGDYCILTGPVVLAAALSPIQPKIRIVCGVAWASAAVATVLTIARMPSMLFITSSVCVLLTVHGFQLNWKRVVVILALGLLVSAMFYRGLDGLAERQVAASAADTEEGGRSGHYQMGWTMARDHPFGVGLNNWGWYFHQYGYLAGHENPIPYTSTREAGEGVATQGHTLYGLTLGELGWPGLLIFVALIGRWLCLSGSFVFARMPDVWSRIGVGCFFGFAAEFVGNSTEITFRNQHIFIIFNLLIGLSVAALYIRKQNSRENRHG